ncbi:hypothetical protein THAOC_34337, partial [Thalassiosira oceanica]
SSARSRTSLSAGEEETCTIQVLMSDTGGGHRASANALRDAFNVLHETEPAQFPLPIHCDIVDIYTDYGPFFPFNQYVPLYKIMAEYSFLWKWFYEFGATPLGLWMNELALETFCFEPFKQCMTRNPMDVRRNDKRADMVVSVHPLCQDLPLKILNELDSNRASRSYGRKTPFVTVVTDLGGAHPTDAALARSVKEGKIVQYGLPIRRGFWGSCADDTKETEEEDEAVEMNGANQKSSIREKLGIADLPTVLIVGGGDGMGGIVSQAQAVGEKLQQIASSSGKSYQMVVVCGNNQAAQKELSPSQTSWGGDIEVSIQGFVNNMDDFMRASDILVTKAGPGTIAEASICGLPCILSSFLPGQEEGNVPYVVDNGFGCYQGTPEGIADTVQKWLEASTENEGNMLENMRERALTAARPDATLDIARDLAQMVYERKEYLKSNPLPVVTEAPVERVPVPYGAGRPDLF